MLISVTGEHKIGSGGIEPPLISIMEEKDEANL